MLIIIKNVKNEFYNKNCLNYVSKKGNKAKYAFKMCGGRDSNLFVGRLAPTTDLERLRERILSPSPLVGDL